MKVSPRPRQEIGDVGRERDFLGPRGPLQMPAPALVVVDAAGSASAEPIRGDSRPPLSQTLVTRRIGQLFQVLAERQADRLGWDGLERRCRGRLPPLHRQALHLSLR